MEKSALHVWPRGEYMLIALPNTDGSFTVTLFLPNAGDESFQALTNPEAVHALFERRFADAIPLMPRLTEDFFANPTGHLETIRCAPWSFEDQALVLGDAAHAIVPFHGQGMNAAFEDCSAFDRCLHEGGPDRTWNEVFAEFERRRRPNTDAIADMALENYVEMRSTVREPKFQLKKDLSFRLEERHPGRFIPRYSMVMFHTIPYAEAKRRGVIQEEILDELTSATSGAASLDEVDLARADRLIAERLGAIQKRPSPPRSRRRNGATEGSSDPSRPSGSIPQNEGHLEGHAVLHDLPFLDDGLLRFDPRRPDVLQRLVGPLDTCLDGSVEALRRRGDDLSDACDGHETFLLPRCDFAWGLSGLNFRLPGFRVAPEFPLFDLLFLPRPDELQQVRVDLILERRAHPVRRALDRP